MNDHHSPIAHSAYHDLLRSLSDHRVAEIQGSPFRETRGNRTYWYETTRIGSAARKRYIGEDADAFKAAKDRVQAAFLIEAHAFDRPDDLAEARADAQSRGPRWQDDIAASLARMPETAARLTAL